MKHVWNQERIRCGLGNWKLAALNRWTAINKEKRFLEGQSSPQSNALRFAVRISWALTLVGPRVSRAIWESRGSIFVSLPNSCRLGFTGPGDDTLLKVDSTQGVNDCNVPSGTASGVPRQQRQILEPDIYIRCHVTSLVVTIWFPVSHFPLMVLFPRTGNESASDR